MTKVFQRYCKRGVQVQERRENEPAKIEGYGAVFYRDGDPGTEYELWTDVYERILPGAFGDVGQLDVRSLFNHDSNWVLGRTKSNPATLSLSVDDVGLRYVITPPDTQAVRDQVLGPIDRGDVDGSSFMFWVRSARWITETRDGRDIDVRQLEAVDLIEVGPVTFPAYTGTTTGVRVAGDLEEIRRDYDRHKAARRDADAAAWVAVQRRLRRVG
jgi:HK97 family phage prohead protease